MVCGSISLTKTALSTNAKFVTEFFRIEGLLNFDLYSSKMSPTGKTSPIIFGLFICIGLTLSLTTTEVPEPPDSTEPTEKLEPLAESVVGTRIHMRPGYVFLFCQFNKFVCGFDAIVICLIIGFLKHKYGFYNHNVSSFRSTLYLVID